MIARGRFVDARPGVWDGLVPERCATQGRRA